MNIITSAVKHMKTADNVGRLKIKITNFFNTIFYMIFYIFYMYARTSKITREMEC